MADYELHADFNRNGRVDGDTAERALRQRAPGAVLVPNLDADHRSLPPEVKKGAVVQLDRDRSIASARDDEYVPLWVKVNRASAAPGTLFFLRPVGFARTRMRFNDATGNILPQDLSRPGDIPIAVPTKVGRLELTVATKTLAGSPHGHVTDLNSLYEHDDEDETRLRVQLLSVDPTGAETQLDEVMFSVAPFVVLDNASQAQRVYICSLADNEPSFKELDRALKAIKVPLIPVRGDVGGEDTWLQDQFQHTLVQGPDGWRQLLLHMPRLRANSSNGTSAANLSSLVLSHFPSRNVGVFNDLWERELQVQAIDGRPRRIGFRACDRLAVEMNQVFELADLLVESIRRIDRGFDPEWPGTGKWTDVRGWLSELSEQFQKRALEAARKAKEPWKGTLQASAKDARLRLRKLEARLPFDRKNEVVSLPVDKATVLVSFKEADKIFVRALQMHDSSNYGGNVEASPPTRDAPLGKLVLGNAVIGGTRDFMDPDVLRLFYKQRKQPIVQLDTTWLDVGHVDEIMTFVPDRRRSSFAVLHASPGLAHRILVHADSRYQVGLPLGHEHRNSWQPFAWLTRETVKGTAPITRMFRGKAWRHVHRPPGDDEIPQRLEPPRVYQRLAQILDGGSPHESDPDAYSIHEVHYWPGEGEDRAYPADMTVREALFVERDLDWVSTNEFIEENRLAGSIEQLSQSFPDARAFPLPVLFDGVASTAKWSEQPWTFATTAFSPDVVNLQAINGHLFIPRPYGPRMRLADALEVLAAAAVDMDVDTRILSRVDERFVRQHKLRHGVYWLKKERYSTPLAENKDFVIWAGFQTEDDVIKLFHDSFPGASDDELYKKIIRPNARHFDGAGNLLDGWRDFHIAEDMVDLFETWIHAVAAELEVPITFVDSWYYHVLSGGIHCGTNVLRLPDRSRPLPKVWSVDDVFHPGETIQFEPEELGAAR